MKEPPIEIPPAVRNSIVPAAVILVIGISAHRFIASELRRTEVHTTLEQVCALQNVYRVNHRFYASSLEDLGLKEMDDGYTYSVVAADDVSFVVRGAREINGEMEIWQVNETGTITAKEQERRETL